MFDVVYANDGSAGMIVAVYRQCPYSWSHDYLHSKGEIFDVNIVMYCKTCRNRLCSIKNQSGIPKSSIIEHVAAENDSMETDEDGEKL